MDGLYTLSGFLVGLIVGLTGVGGGSLMTPLLVLLFGISPATAVGTDLLYASLTKSLGGWVHARNGTVDWLIVKRLSLGSIPAALLTLEALHALVLDDKALRGVITPVLGLALLLTAVGLLFKERIQKRALQQENGWLQRHLTAATIATGAVVGVLVTLSSIGAGVLGTVAVLFLYPRLSTVRVVGTDIAHAVPLTAVAGMGHFALGTVNLTLLGSLLIGSLPGIYLGSQLSHKLPEKILRPLLASMLLIIGAKMAM